MAELNRLTPGTLTIDEQPRRGLQAHQYAFQVKCPACRGKKLTKKELEAGKAPCWRCDGAGQMLDTSGQKSSRSKRSDGLTSAELAGYAAPLRDVEWWAVLAVTCNEVFAREPLIKALYPLILTMEKEEKWQYQATPGNPQTYRLACLAIDELIHPHNFKTKKMYCMYMPCDPKTWGVRWRVRYERILKIPQQWLTSGQYGIEAAMYLDKE